MSEVSREGEGPYPPGVGIFDFSETIDTSLLWGEEIEVRTYLEDLEGLFLRFSSEFPRGEICLYTGGCAKMWSSARQHTCRVSLNRV